MENLNDLKVTELRRLAQEKGLANVTKLKKDELINLLSGKETKKQNTDDLNSGEISGGILEILPDGYGFLRSENFLNGEKDVYISASQIRRFDMKTGDYVQGNVREPRDGERFRGLLFVKSVNGENPEEAKKRIDFEKLVPIYPNEKLELENNDEAKLSSRIIDLFAPIGKGQRGMIVAPPKVGKTILLKEIAKALSKKHSNLHLIILLIDERPEEVTDIKRDVEGENVDVVYSTFDERPEHHKKVAEMVIERAKRLVEHSKDVVILLDSITRLARAYNLTTPPSGRTLSGGIDPAALHMPKKFFGAARNVEGGGSLTILATALTETGSKMDDVIFEEFKGTGNMELVLERELANRRVYPAINIVKSGTRREDLLLSKEELETNYVIRNRADKQDQLILTEQLITLMKQNKTNYDFVKTINKK
ncbi:MAG: transcription termination factor Rho [Clostridia bacterium]|nr:transcription termination factor Rho [Clostridia bacterium]